MLLLDRCRATEKFYDAFGTLGFISTTAFSLLWHRRRLEDLHPRQLLLSSLTIIWSVRLGHFLYGRIHKTGHDSRFDGIRNAPATFTAIWLIQALWVSLTALPVYLVNALAPSIQPALGMRDFLAIIGWFAAFTLEVSADRQKQAWKLGKERKEHDDPFINSGLVRHSPFHGSNSL
jgi:steroid 5-alpha reductase family enzyme